MQLNFFRKPEAIFLSLRTTHFTTFTRYGVNVHIGTQRSEIASKVDNIKIVLPLTSTLRKGESISWSELT